SCGYRMGTCPCADSTRVLELLRAAPNVIATLNGHGHWSEVNAVEGIVHIQNAAFSEWPDSYRVFRVYNDRMEWETRQPRNRGFPRASFIVEKAQSWMIATGPEDLTGTIPLAR
ncbi:MAG: hypothetical protein J7M38_09815, partial [Armatimonadetes bacterium]|nr:hypothetical protein [Armatimonadota bacterium]